jgi:hypothetical protein
MGTIGIAGKGIAPMGRSYGVVPCLPAVVGPVSVNPMTRFAAPARNALNRNNRGSNNRARKPRAGDRAGH